MRFNIIPSHFRFSQTGPVVVLLLLVFLLHTGFSKTYAEPKKEILNKNELQVAQAQPRETVKVCLLSVLKTETQKREAWMKAGEYAKAHPAIGIAVYGRAEDATSEQVGQFIQGIFSKQGIKSQYFLSEIERMGVGVSFYLKDVAYGPTSLQKSVDNVRTIIQHFLEAWPDYQRSITAPTGGNN
jgi:flagellar capping protein FliD